MKKVVIFVVLMVMGFYFLPIVNGKVNQKLYEMVLEGTWSTNVEYGSGKYSFTYPGKTKQLTFYPDGNDLFLVASGQKVYLVVDAKSEYNRGWYEILLSDDNNKIVLSGNGKYSGIYYKK